jgi:hypothetical protein
MLLPMGNCFYAGIQLTGDAATLMWLFSLELSTGEKWHNYVLLLFRKQKPFDHHHRIANPLALSTMRNFCCGAGAMAVIVVPCLSSKLSA